MMPGLFEDSNISAHNNLTNPIEMTGPQALTTIQGQGMTEAQAGTQLEGRGARTGDQATPTPLTAPPPTPPSHHQPVDLSSALH